MELLCYVHYTYDHASKLKLKIRTIIGTYVTYVLSWYLLMTLTKCAL